MGIRDIFPQPPWQGPPVPPHRVSDYCYNLAFFTSMAYEEAVKLLYDLTTDRPEYAKLRLDTLRDIMPQLRGLKLGMDELERMEVIRRLGEVEQALEQNDVPSAHFSADQLVAGLRMALLNTVVRCERSRW